MKHVFLICYDNGQDYEDHRDDVVCVASTREAADAELQRLNAWLQRARNRIPDVPEIPGGPEAVDETKAGRAWLRAHEANEQAVKRARMPHGCELIRHSLCSKDQGSFSVYKIKLIG